MSILNVDDIEGTFERLETPLNYATALYGATGRFILMNLMSALCTVPLAAVTKPFHALYETNQYARDVRAYNRTSYNFDEISDAFNQLHCGFIIKILNCELTGLPAGTTYFELRFDVLDEMKARNLESFDGGRIPKDNIMRLMVNLAEL